MMAEIDETRGPGSHASLAQEPNGAAASRANGGTSPLEKPKYDPLAPSAIDVNHIVKKYGDFTAVNDVSFDVKDGEIFGLLGPNGAGKSTLIRMMTTLIPITAGYAKIGGHDVSKDPDAPAWYVSLVKHQACADVWKLPAASCIIQEYSFSMNRRRVSIPFRAWLCGRCSATSSSSVS